MRKSLTWLLGTAILCLGLTPAAQAQTAKDPQMTGLRELTPEELEMIDRTHPKVKKVKLNRTGLDRVNAHRKKKGMPPLSHKAAVADGEELLTVVGTADPGTAETDSAMSALPSSVDNSTLKYFPPIRSQGSLGSCAMFSGIYYAMTYMYAKAHDLDAKAGGDAMRLSPKFGYNMLNGGQNTGTWYYWAYDLGIKHGISSWLEFPYDSNYRAWPMDPEIWRSALHRRFLHYGQVANTNTDAGQAIVKQMLIDGYVLNIPTYINSWQYKTIGNDPATTEDDAFAGKTAAYWVNGTQGYHAMTVVGFNDHIWVDINGNGTVDTGEKGAFRIANSWGTGWGEAGYRWMAYDALKSPSGVSGGPSAGRIAGWSPAIAHWVVPRTNYTPKLVGKFTLNHVKRNQVGVTLGTSEVNQSVPSASWYPYALTYDGGALAFNGTTSAVDGTFYMDFTDLVPAVSGAKRFYVGARDSATGDALQLKDFKLIDMAKGAETASSSPLQTADANQVYAFVDYSFDSGNLAPIAAVSVNTLSGTAPLHVVFDAGGSSDPDGSLASFAWDFGDGVTGSGTQVSHAYTYAGTYTANLRVTDNQGGFDTAAVTIGVLPDPNLVEAPADLKFTLSGSTVTLSWSDRSGNETSFYIDQATKGKGKNASVAYQRIGQVGADVTSFAHTISTGTYYYRVQAVNSSTGKVSAYSNAVTVNKKR